MAANAGRLLVDIHTHVYLPRYASLLRARTKVPRILSQVAVGGQSEERLLILGHEPSGGRPVGPQVRVLACLASEGRRQTTKAVLGSG